MISNYKQSIIDILDNFVTNLKFPCQVWNVAANTPKANQYTLNVDNIYHAVIGYTVTLLGIDGMPHSYSIVGWTETPGAYKLVVEDLTTLNPVNANQIFNFYPAFFFHGTPIDATDEIKQIKDYTKKFPMVFLWENYKEKFHNDPSDSLEREVPLMLYFLTDSPNQKLETDDLDMLYVRPMRRLMDNFILALNSPFSNIQPWDTDYTTQNYYKFGIVARTKGVKENLMTDKCTGVELSITLKIYKPQPVQNAYREYDDQSERNTV